MLSVHGSRINSNYLTLNGAYFNNASRNTGMNPPPPDAVREFRIKTNNFSAAEGRNSGSVVSLVTRSGTNDFHGSVWEFHRNTALNAANFFDGPIFDDDGNFVGKDKSKRIMNQFGVAAGGPILRNRLHFFASYEGFRDRPQPATTDAFPPTEPERAGDFSHVERQLFNPYSGEPFLNNQIPTSLFDGVSLNLLKSIPLPNQPDDRLVTNNPIPDNNDLVIFRNDFQISDRQNLFWHYYYNKFDRAPRLHGNIPGWQHEGRRVRSHSFGLTHNFVLSPTFMNSLTFGLAPGNQQNFHTERRAPADLGIDLPDYTNRGSVGFSVPGRMSLSGAGGDLWYDQKAFNLHESMSWINGHHALKFGFEFFRLEFAAGWWPRQPGFSFSVWRTGNPEDWPPSGDAMVEFLLGAWTGTSIGFGQRLNDTIQPWYWSFYFQDEWRVSSRFTLTLGMRYELPSPWNDKRDLGLSNIVLPLDNCREDLNNPGNPKDLETCGAQRTTAPMRHAPPPGYLFANYDLPKGLVQTDKNNFAPRLGFALDIFGDGRTSLRGGGGVFYETANADTLAQVNPPFGDSFRYRWGQLGAPSAGILESSLPPIDFNPADSEFTLPMYNVLSTDLSLRNTYTFHWNLGIQQQLKRDLMVSIDYVGKIARKLLAFYPWNPAVYIPGTDSDGNPLSTLENIDDRVLYGRGTYGAYYNVMLGSMYDAWYHGMDVQVNKRLSDGFSLLTSFTWSKAIDQNSSSHLGGLTSNPFDIKKSDQGLADFDRRLVFAISALWEPFRGTGGGGFLSALLSDWNLSPIIIARTGRPLEFITGLDNAMDGRSDSFGWAPNHPVALRNPAKTHDSTESKISEWFDTTALEQPLYGTYGNAARGLVTGPGFFTFELGILRDFPLGISEGSRLQFRAEFFNLFNNPDFDDPDTELTSDTFGQILQTNPYGGGAREIQFGLKFLW